jgi:translation initiation factor 1 (eIF-1/SUI1)
MSRHKQKIASLGEISLGGEKNFSAPIASILGGEEISVGEKVSAPEKKPGLPAKSIKSALLRRESAGRGGRVVTAVELRPPAGAAETEAIAKAMRKSLGCGSHVEGDRIILQGDIGDRAEAWLAKQGIARVTRGN